jgi:predicted short-subunit dehydrogenase-like oxidoreductase (DUF2520 family)
MDSSKDIQFTKTIGIIGAGRAGGSFALALGKAGAPILGATVATAEHSRRISAELGVKVYDSNRALAEAADVILLAVPDRTVAEVAMSLRLPIEAKTFLHLSGSLTTDVLSPLQEVGHSIGSLHPLQSFAQATDSFAGVFMAIDGDDGAVRDATCIANMLGGIPFFVPSQDRARYHAAACFCSNYVVTLVSIAQKIMSEWTETEEDALTALLPLLNGTVRNINAAETAGKALTGPIARGDSNTITGHLATLPDSLMEVYCALGLQTSKIAEENGTIDHSEAEQIKALFRR